MDLRLQFKQWLEDVGPVPGNAYSNAEDAQFSAKVNSGRSAATVPREKRQPGTPDAVSVFGPITNFAEPPPGSLPNKGVNMAKMSKKMKKE